MSNALRKAPSIKAMAELLKTYQGLTYHKWFLYLYVGSIAAYAVSILWSIGDLATLLTVGILNHFGASYIITDTSSMVTLPLFCAVSSVLFIACMTMIIINDANAMKFDEMDKVKLLKLKYGIMPKINEYGYVD